MLDMRISHACGLPELDPAMDRYQRFGIELEYEHVRRAIDLTGTRWTAVRDGSLRNNGVEYVSDPLSYRDVGPSLTSIMRSAAGVGARVTPRCGLHVHLNMRPYTVGQVLSLAVVYGLAEPSIFKHFAEGRDLSPFCVPQYANTLLLNHLEEDTQQARRGRGRLALRGTTGTSKYSALNYSSLRRFGTVEARHLPCTLDPREAREWVEFLKRMVDYAVEFNDPLHVMEHYEGGGLEELQDDLFGEAVEVDPLDQEDAVVSCTLVAGADVQEAVRLDDGGVEIDFDELVDVDEFQEWE